jgi:MarR family 2-MHQ and catechol resistance regulon transcriptional repressor
VVYAALTPAGRELVEEIFPEHARVIAELFDVLTPEERADLRRILKKLGLTVSANRG